MRVASLTKCSPTHSCQMMVSLCTEYWQLFLAQGVGLGLAMGFVFNLSIGTPSHWFKKRRATAMGM